MIIDYIYIFFSPKAHLIRVNCTVTPTGKIAHKATANLSCVSTVTPNGAIHFHDIASASLSCTVTITPVGATPTLIYHTCATVSQLFLMVEDPIKQTITPVAAIGGLQVNLDSANPKQWWEDTMNYYGYPIGNSRNWTEYFGFCWADANGDGLIEASEVTLNTNKSVGVGTTLNGIFGFDAQLNALYPQTISSSSPTGPLIQRVINTGTVIKPTWSWNSNVINDCYVTSPGEIAQYTFYGSGLITDIRSEYGNTYLISKCYGRLISDVPPLLWPNNVSTINRFLGFNNGVEIFNVGRHSRLQNIPPTPGTFADIRSFVGTANGCVVIRSAMGAASVWTANGMYAGTFFDYNDTSDPTIPALAYGVGDFGSGPSDGYNDPQDGQVVTLDTGEVYWLCNDGQNTPIYLITGWTGWVTQTGTITQSSQPDGPSGTGNGLTANIYPTLDLSGPPSITRIDPTIWFGPMVGPFASFASKNNFNAGMAQFSATWIGFVEVPVGEAINFIIYCYGGTNVGSRVRLTINGSLLINQWSNVNLSGTVNSQLYIIGYETGPIAISNVSVLSIELDYVSTGNSNDSLHLFWETVNLDPVHISQNYLYTSNTASSPAALYNFSYTQAGTGQTSVSIFNSAGQMVRPIQYGVIQSPGTYSLTWDGLDRYGTPQPIGTYTWQTLTTPGFTRRFLVNLGTQPPWSTFDYIPGNHSPITYISLDATGIYLTTAYAEGPPSIIKISLDGSELLWSASGIDGVGSGAFLPCGVAIFNNLPPIGGSPAPGLYICLTAGNIYISSTITPYFPATGSSLFEHVVNPWLSSVTTNGLGGSVNNLQVHMKNGTNILVISDQLANAVHFLYPGQAIYTAGSPNTTVSCTVTTVTITSPTGICATPSDGVYISVPNQVVSLNTTTLATTVVVNDPTLNPGILQYEPISTNLLVYDIVSNNIKRYSSVTGSLIATYGRTGGRLYNSRFNPQDFDFITDITVDGAGGFWTVENYPSRVAHFDNNGILLTQWIGPQLLAYQSYIDPSNPTNCYMALDGIHLSKGTIDYSNRTWSLDVMYEPNILFSLGDTYTSGQGYYGTFPELGNRFWGISNQTQTAEIVANSTITARPTGSLKWQGTSNISCSGVITAKGKEVYIANVSFICTCTITPISQVIHKTLSSMSCACVISANENIIAASSGLVFIVVAINNIAKGNEIYGGLIELSNNAAVTAKGNEAYVAKSNLLGISSIVATSAVSHKTSSSKSCIAAVTVTGKVLHVTSSSMSCIAAVTVTGKVLHSAKSNISCVSTVTVTGKVLHKATSNITCVSTITVTGKAAHATSSNISCVSTVTVTGKAAHATSSSISCIAAVSATGKTVIASSGISNLVVISTISATSTVSPKTSSSMSCTSAVTTTGKVAHKATSSISCTCTVTATDHAIYSGKSTITCISTITATGKVLHAGSTSISCVSAITAKAKVAYISHSSVSCIFTVVAASKLVHKDSTSISCASTIAVTGKLLHIAKSYISCISTVTPTAIVLTHLSCVSTVTAKAKVAYKATCNMVCISRIFVGAENLINIYQCFEQDDYGWMNIQIVRLKYFYKAIEKRGYVDPLRKIQKQTS